MANNGVDKGWFLAALADKGLSQRRLAAYMGLDPSAVSLILSGKRRMTATEVAEIARLLDKPVQDVLAHVHGPGAGARRVAGADRELEAEFRRKWAELGELMLRMR